VAEEILLKFRTEADQRGFERENKNFTGALEDRIKLVRKYGGEVADLNNATARLGIEAVVDGLPIFGKLEKALTDDEKAYRKLMQVIKDKTKADKDSVFAIRQTLSEAKQKLALMSKLNPKYTEQAIKVDALTSKHREAQGIQQGSVALIRLETKALQDQLNVLNLSSAQRQILTQAISANQAAERQAAGIEKGSINDLRARQAEQQKLADSLRVGSAEQIKAAQSAQQLGNQIQAATPKTVTFIGVLNKIATVQAGFTAIINVFRQITGSIDEVVKRLKQVEQFNLAMQNIGFSASEAADKFQAASRTAGQLGAPLEVVEKAYKRITPALQSIGTSAADTDKFIKNLIARTQILGLSTEQSGRLVEAFAQVLSKGKLQSEELNQQISELDGGFRNDLAKSLGVTTGQLNDMVQESQVLDTVFRDAFLGMGTGAEILEGKVASGNSTIQQLQNNISLINTKTLEEIGVAIEPGIRAFLRAGEAFAKLVQSIAESAVGQLLATVFNQIAAATEFLVDTVSGLVNILLFLAQPIAAVLTLASPLIAAFLTLTVSIKGAQVATVAFNAAVKGLKVLSGFSGSLGFATEGLKKFALAGKQILFLDLKGAFFNAANGMGKFIQSLNISFINNAIAKLKELRQAQQAAAVVDGAADAAGNAGNAFDFLSSVLELIPGKFGKLGQGASKAGSTAAAAAAKQVAGEKAVSAELGRTAQLRKKYGLQQSQDSIRLQNNFKALAATESKALGTTEALAAGAGNAGKGFAGAAGNLLKFAKGTALLIVAATAGEAFFNVVGGINESTGAAGKSISELEGTLGQLGITTQKTKGFWGSLLDTIINSVPFLRPLVDGIGFLMDKFQGLGLEIGRLQNIDRFKKSLESVGKVAREAGLTGFGDLTNAQKLNGATAKKLVGSYEALGKSFENTAAGYQELITKGEAEGNLSEDRKKQLERLRDEQLNLSATFKYYARNLDNATKAQQAQNKQLEDAKGLALGVTETLKKKNEALDTAQTQLQTQAQQEYNQGLISEGDLNLRNAAIDAKVAQDKLSNINAAIQQASQARGKEEKDVEELYQLEKGLIEQKAAAEAEAAKAKAALLEAEKAKIKEVADAAKTLSDVYKKSADDAKGALDDLASSTSDTLDKLKDAITQRANIEIGADNTAALQVEGQILAINYTIGKVKQEIASREREHAITMQELETKRAIAALQRGPQTAQSQAEIAALQDQLRLLNDIRGLNQTTDRIQQIGLDAQIQKEQEALNIQRAAAGLPPLQIVDVQSLEGLKGRVDEVFNAATASADKLGSAVSSNLSKSTDAAKQGISQIENISRNSQAQQDKLTKTIEQGINNITKGIEALASKNYGVEIGKQLSKTFNQGIDKWNKQITQSPEKVQAVAEKTKVLAGGFSDVGKQIIGVNQHLKSTNTLMEEAARRAGNLPGGGLGALAHGGPVMAGTSYLVNDGGGREAFVNKFGQAKLLPASRNIAWRAPSDGFVIPADQTAAMIQNSKINAKISAVSSASKPRHGANFASSGLTSSGNLIKQVGAMMGGNKTERITNHVTIQSQSPVMDASKIMANVARMRVRRGIFG